MAMTSTASGIDAGVAGKTENIIHFAAIERLGDVNLAKIPTKLGADGLSSTDVLLANCRQPKLNIFLIAKYHIGEIPGNPHLQSPMHVVYS